MPPKSRSRRAQDEIQFERATEGWSASLEQDGFEFVGVGGDVGAGSSPMEVEATDEERASLEHLRIKQEQEGQMEGIVQGDRGENPDNRREYLGSI